MEVVSKARIIKSSP